MRDFLAGLAAALPKCLKGLEAQFAAAQRAPEDAQTDLNQLRDAATRILERLRPALEGNPEQARDVLMGLFRTMVFKPVKTKEGPRFRIEGDAHVGKFLGIEGAEPVAVLNGRPYVDEFRTALVALSAA